MTEVLRFYMNPDNSSLRKYVSSELFQRLDEVNLCDLLQAVLGTEDTHFAETFVDSFGKREFNALVRRFFVNYKRYNVIGVPHVRSDKVGICILTYLLDYKGHSSSPRSFRSLRFLIDTRRLELFDDTTEMTKGDCISLVHSINNCIHRGDGHLLFDMIERRLIDIRQIQYTLLSLVFDYTSKDEEIVTLEKEASEQKDQLGLLASTNALTPAAVAEEFGKLLEKLNRRDILVKYVSNERGEFSCTDLYLSMAEIAAETWQPRVLALALELSPNMDASVALVKATKSVYTCNQQTDHIASLRKKAGGIPTGIQVVDMLLRSGLAGPDAWKKVAERDMRKHGMSSLIRW